MPNQRVKNDLKAKKIKFPQMKLFLKKQWNFHVPISPFILQNIKRILWADPELSGCAIFSHKMAHLSWTIFFWYKPLLLLLSTCCPFFLCKIYNKFLWPIQSCENAPFLGPKWCICPKQMFLENYWYHFYLTISPFHCAKFQKNPSSGSRVMRMCNFWTYNNPFAQMIIFFRKPVNEPCSFHSCLSTCQKSKSDISLLLKYWQLKILKSHWLRDIFGYNLRTRFFPSMQFSQNVNEP